MGSSPDPPPIPPVPEVTMPPPPMQESPYAKGSFARKQSQAMSSKMSMAGTLITGGRGLTDKPETTGKTLLGV